jgi:hypothetical protein
MLAFCLILFRRIKKLNEDEKDKCFSLFSFIYFFIYPIVPVHLSNYLESRILSLQYFRYLIGRLPKPRTLHCPNPGHMPRDKGILCYLAFRDSEIQAPRSRNTFRDCAVLQRGVLVMVCSSRRGSPRYGPGVEGIVVTWITPCCFSCEARGAWG